MRTLVYLVAMLAASVASAAQEKLSTVPDDSGKDYLTIFGLKGETSYERMKSDIMSPDLREIRATVHLNFIDVGTVAFERYAASVQQLPFVMKQTATGEPIYGEAGYHSRQRLLRVFRCRPKPQPSTPPNLPPQPSSVEVDVQTDPPVSPPPPPPAEPTVGWGFVAAIAIVITVAGFVSAWRGALNRGK